MGKLSTSNYTPELKSENQTNQIAGGEITNFTWSSIKYVVTHLEYLIYNELMLSFLYNFVTIVDISQEFWNIRFPNMNSLGPIISECWVSQHTRKHQKKFKSKELWNKNGICVAIDGSGSGCLPNKQTERSQGGNKEDFKNFNWLAILKSKWFWQNYSFLLLNE